MQSGRCCWDRRRPPPATFETLKLELCRERAGEDACGPSIWSRVDSKEPSKGKDYFSIQSMFILTVTGSPTTKLMKAYCLKDFVIERIW